jgi:hypothetical protein
MGFSVIFNLSRVATGYTRVLTGGLSKVIFQARLSLNRALRKKAREMIENQNVGLL